MRPASTPAAPDPRIARYFEALEARHLKDLTFAEVARSLRALSAAYVEKRDRGGLSRALDGRGKRAAFALYYGATHLLATRALILDRGLGFSGARSGRTVLDLGCGTGVCGAAWALLSDPGLSVVGVDRSPFALHEARWTYRTLGIKGVTRPSIREALEAGDRPDGIVLGWTLNELDEAARVRIADRLVAWVSQGSRLLVIEPVSARVAPWWDAWCARLGAVARAEEARVPLLLPPRLALLGRSAGLRAETAALRILASTPPAPGGVA